MEMTAKAIRILGDDYYGGGHVSFDGWGGLNDYEKMAAKAFEEGIENTLVAFPPDMNVQPNSNYDDLIITFSLDGLGKNGDSGPVWQFSIKEAFADLCDHHEDDKTAVIASLKAVVEFVRTAARARVNR
jgi:hypothetical protein